MTPRTPKADKAWERVRARVFRAAIRFYRFVLNENYGMVGRALNDSRGRVLIDKLNTACRAARPRSKASKPRGKR